ncbi:putative hydrolase of the HAD superfamily [Marinitoga hydrogenitolerans DSM 16785]|uniref:Hydrolase of the HAD superfamily n=1 Tax=Marinitoga hydrogenitolerans (strain DSM 16785 / JCM 12826 / AT1271) TaxID=1122195 RepID=A0A1M4WQS0_MARH1|nr:HAD family hydrolase [Marinitoga hydrogenitolerans]SHE83413.1 putative hydrolase of the HAD superfamily [Marinitoga hydrogenitolerans DSM 16785]
MIKGIIFDLYGTLINANQLFLPIAKIISNEIGQPADILEKNIKETYNKHFKDYHLKPFKPEREYYKLLFNELKENLNLKNSIDYYIDEMYKTFIDLKPYDDVEHLNTIKEKGLKIAILSNADNDFVLPSLEKNIFPFDILITSHSTKLYKPDPKIFDYTLNKIKLNKEEVIFIGDNYNVDILGGINYGIKSILIKRIPSNLNYPDTIYSLKELFKYIY